MSRAVTSSAGVGQGEQPRCRVSKEGAPRDLPALLLVCWGVHHCPSPPVLTPQGLVFFGCYKHPRSTAGLRAQALLLGQLFPAVVSSFLRGAGYSKGIACKEQGMRI